MAPLHEFMRILRLNSFKRGLKFFQLLWRSLNLNPTDGFNSGAKPRMSGWMSGGS